MTHARPRPRRHVRRPLGAAPTLAQLCLDFEGVSTSRSAPLAPPRPVDHHFDLAAHAHRQLARRGPRGYHMSPELLVYWGTALEHHMSALRRLLDDNGADPPDWSRHPGAADYYRSRSRSRA